MTPLHLQTRPQVLAPAGAGAALLFMAFGWGPNVALVGFAITVLFLGILMLWRPGEPPVMLLIFALQWLQASTKAINANIQGMGINEISAFGGDVELASYLSLIGLLLFAMGLQWGAGPWRPELIVHNQAIAAASSQRVWFGWYGFALAASMMLEGVAYTIPGLSQPLLAAAHIRWAFFFMLTYAAFLAPWHARLWWVGAAVVEFLIGIGGYFSDFKAVFLYAALGIAAAGVRFTPKKVLGLAAVVLVTVYVGLLWTAVKGEFRNFVSDGQAAQIVTVDYGERVSHLAKLVSQVDGARLSEASDQLLSRLAYVEFFGAAIDYVPKHIAHTGGEIWWDAIKRPFMPRIFFPEKSVIDDSERTALYTGLGVSGADKGTSISIGYMGESYIDFGYAGMMAPVLLLGYLLGRVYRWLTWTGRFRGLLGTGLACSTLMAFSFMESSITKVFGGFIATLLVLWVFGWSVAPRYLRWLVPHQADASPARAHSAGALHRQR